MPKADAAHHGKSKNATYQMKCQSCKKMLVWSKVDETQIQTDVLVCYESECGEEHSIKEMLRKGILSITRFEKA